VLSYAAGASGAKSLMLPSLTGSVGMASVKSSNPIDFHSIGPIRRSPLAFGVAIGENGDGCTGQ
jgi:hypothetical protein